MPATIAQARFEVGSPERSDARIVAAPEETGFLPQHLDAPC